MDGWMALSFIWMIYGITATLVFLKQRSELRKLRKDMFNPKIDGKVIIDHSDPDVPYIFLQLEKGVDSLTNRKLLYLEVDNQGLSRD